MEVGHLTVYSDSQLVINQVKRDFEAKKERMQEYLTMVKTLLKKFHHFQIQHVLTKNNVIADALAKFALSSNMAPGPTSTGHQFEPSMLKTDLGSVNCASTDDDWTTPIQEYLEDGLSETTQWKPKS